MKFEEIQKIAIETLDLIHPLAVGPNTYKTNPVFGAVVEGVLRRDMMTLDTILFLSQQEKEKHKVSGSSCMDLARAVLEDLVGLAYMALKGKEKYAKQFLAYKAVELQALVDLNTASGRKTDEQLLADLEAAKKGASKHFFKSKSRSWAKRPVDDIIVELEKSNTLKDWESNALLTTYLIGNQKNHLSPLSIQNYMHGDLFDQAGENDMTMSLAFVTFAVLKMANIFIEEIEDRPEIDKEAIREMWQTILALKPTENPGSK